MKEWSCCKQRSHDFSLFLALPGCKKGKHTTEKPVTTAVPSKKRPTPPALANKQVDTSKLDCSRCRQGFFCSDHGSETQMINLKPAKPVVTPSDSDVNIEKVCPAPVKKIDLNQPQTCRNKGCGKTFMEKENHASACEYHPGPPVFHDRIRGWKCCDIHVKEFDEFMNIPPCTKGWHNADPVP